jgi:hypothetical protein
VHSGLKLSGPIFEVVAFEAFEQLLQNIFCATTFPTFASKNAFFSLVFQRLIKKKIN